MPTFGKKQLFWYQIQQGLKMNTRNFAHRSLMDRILIDDENALKLSKTSKNLYISKFKKIDKVAKELGYEIVDEVATLAALKKILGSADTAYGTARIYKSAALYIISEQARELYNKEQDISSIELIYEQIQEIDTKHLKRTSDKTSGAKFKYFSKELYEHCIQELAQSPKAHQKALLSFLKANMSLGLRPNEWFQSAPASYLYRDTNGAYIKDEMTGSLKFENTLVVTNSKYSNGRANGDSREILIGDRPETIESISAFLSIIYDHIDTNLEGISHSAPDEYNVWLKKLSDRFYEPLQSLLKRTAKKLNDTESDGLTLYSTRHQVVANAKKTGLNDIEIAALFGHNSKHTAKRHYGKKTSGWKNIEVRPSVESIQAVKHAIPKLEVNLDNHSAPKSFWG